MLLGVHLVGQLALGLLGLFRLALCPTLPSPSAIDADAVAPSQSLLTTQMP